MHHIAELLFYCSMGNLKAIKRLVRACMRRGYSSSRGQKVTSPCGAADPKRDDRRVRPDKECRLRQENASSPRGKVSQSVGASP